MWAPQSPLVHGPGYEFGNQVNHLATDFAVRAILAQPAEYLRVAWDSAAQTFMPEHDTNLSQYLVLVSRDRAAVASGPDRQ